MQLFFCTNNVIAIACLKLRYSSIIILLLNPGAAILATSKILLAKVKPIWEILMLSMFLGITKYLYVNTENYQIGIHTKTFDCRGGQHYKHNI